MITELAVIPTYLDHIL